MFEGEVARSKTAKGLKIINILRAAMYFSVVGIQWIHYTTESVVPSILIFLVPMLLGTMDSVMIGLSTRDSMGVKFDALGLSIISIVVAIDTIAPIVYFSGPLSEYLTIMFYLSLGVILISVIELTVVILGFYNSMRDDQSISLPGSVRTYDRWE